MSQTITPTYRVEYRDNINPKISHTMAWRGKRDGRANAANLEIWRKAYNVSFQSGGVNDHIAKSLNVIPHIFFAQLVRQSTGAVVAETLAPMFEVV